MTYNNSSMPESTEQNNSVTNNISEESKNQFVNTPTNLEKTFPEVISTQSDKSSQTKKALQIFGSNLFQAVKQLSEEVAEKTTRISNEATKSATEFAKDVIKSATEHGQAAVKSVAESSQEVAESTAKLTQEAAKSALSQEPVREALLIFANQTQASQAAKEASVEAHVKQVNSASVKKFIAVLKERFPNKTSEEIAQQVVVQQTLRITGNSAALIMIPGKLAESMGFDQATLTLMQAETIYQIAEAYALDLSTSERKEEALVVFDRAFRSARQMKMSMNLGVVPTLPIVGGILSSIPILGGVLNVGSDAFLISLIGDVACQLYKAIGEEKVAGEALKAFKQETQTQYKLRLW